MLHYLLSRLTAAQGFDAYVTVDGSCHRTADPEELIRVATKKARSEKGGRVEIKVHRYYGSHPQERSASVWVKLHAIHQPGEGLVLDPKANIEVVTPDNTVPYKPGQYPMLTLPVPVTRPKATWMALLETVTSLRRFRQPRSA